MKGVIPIQVSVVMPVYNAADTLDEAIQSILDQKFKAFEFVIIDDGSEDASPDIIKKWAAADARIHPLFCEHRGIVHALNYGIEQAGGKYIVRMDADDISHPQRLKKQASFLDAHSEVGLVACQVEHLGKQEKQKGYARYVDWTNRLISHEEISTNRFIESPLAHPSVCFRSSLVDQYGSYRQGNFPEDYELWLRWLEQGIKMHKLTDPLLKWRDQDSRLSRNHERYSSEAFYQIKAQYLTRWLDDHNPQHPEVVIWGAGRQSRKRAEMLTKHGITITHYIDVNPNKIGQNIHGRPVWSPDEIPPPGSHFVISFVGNRGVNKKISGHLSDRGYQLGSDFIFAA